MLKSDKDRVVVDREYLHKMISEMTFKIDVYRALFWVMAVYALGITIKLYL